MARRTKLKDEEASNVSNWPQTFFFAEGTCTNGQALIQFKSGAFRLGLPVQPVLLRPLRALDKNNPGKYKQAGANTITWTWIGLRAFPAFWYTLCQFGTKFVVITLGFD